MIDITFHCENHNDVLLLAATFDIITGVEVDDSIAMTENIGWLIEEIISRLEEVDQWDVNEGEHALTGNALEICLEYGPRLRGIFKLDKERS